MKLRKTLLSIIAGTALAFSPTNSREATIDVPVYQWGVDVQSAIDSAQAGDTINIIRGDYSLAFTGGWIVDKDLTFTAPDISIRQNQDTLMTVINNANVSVNFNFASADYNQTMIKVNDQASLNLNNSTLVNGINYIEFNSSGTLRANQNYFSGTEGTTQSGIVLNNTSGDIAITKNFFGWNTSPITINAVPIEQPQFSVNRLGIANNTMSIAYDSGIKINGTLDSAVRGYIVNNNITDTPDAMTEAGVGDNVIVTENNFYETIQAQPMSLKTSLKSMSLSSIVNTKTNIFNNYSFDPLLENIGYSDAVSSNSPVYGKGIFVDALTPIDPSKPYIGSFNQTMPEAVPEPKTWHMIVGGLALLYALNKTRKRNG